MQVDLTPAQVDTVVSTLTYSRHRLYKMAAGGKQPLDKREWAARRVVAIDEILELLSEGR